MYTEIQTSEFDDILNALQKLYQLQQLYALYNKIEPTYTIISSGNTYPYLCDEHKCASSLCGNQEHQWIKNKYGYYGTYSNN